MAIFITSVVYLGMAWVVGMTVNREVAVAMGCNMIITDLRNGSNESCIEYLLVNDETSSSCGLCEEEGGRCERFALLHSFQVIEMISLVGPIITAGKCCIFCYCCCFTMVTTYRNIFSYSVISVGKFNRCTKDIPKSLPRQDIPVYQVFC